MPETSSTRARRRRGPQLVHLPTWSQLSIATRQHGAVGHGGDFFEIIQHREGHVSTLLADVCGNGPSAAVPVSRLRWLVRQHLACGEAPGAVLALLNDAIVAGDEPDLFVTAVCLRIDPQSGSVNVASAGHLGPFIKRASGDAQELITPTGAALGIMPGQAYPETRARPRRGGLGRAGHRRHHRSAGHRVEPARPGRVCSPSSRARARPPNRSARR